METSHEEAEVRLDQAIAICRDLHRHPELGFEERRTAGIMAEYLRSPGLEVEEASAKQESSGTFGANRQARLSL